MPSLPIEFLHFEDRADRAKYVAKRYADQLHGDLLDVGCWKRDLEKAAAGLNSYVGIDIGGDPTQLINLEECERLPFDDTSFDCVVCTEVLEHLDRCHRVFDEIVRVTKPGGSIMISLPNCWRTMRSRIVKGRGTPRFYGLPPEPPEDRHKWFFNVTDVVDFFDAQCKRHPLRVTQTHVQEQPRGAVSRGLRRVWHTSQRSYLNRYADSTWVVLERLGDA
ncbi:MAG: class I SAM-dependent methyltransferase [Planctomycetota bacterium]